MLSKKKQNKKKQNQKTKHTNCKRKHIAWLAVRRVGTFAVT
jgi:hypothetical protein